MLNVQSIDVVISATLNFLKQSIPGIISSKSSLISGDCFYFIYLPTFRPPIQVSFPWAMFNHHIRNFTNNENSGQCEVQESKIPTCKGKIWNFSQPPFISFPTVVLNFLAHGPSFYKNYPMDHFVYIIYCAVKVTIFRNVCQGFMELCGPLRIRWESLLYDIKRMMTPLKRRAIVINEISDFDRLNKYVVTSDNVLLLLLHLLAS